MGKTFPAFPDWGRKHCFQLETFVNLDWETLGNIGKHFPIGNIQVQHLGRPLDDPRRPRTTSVGRSGQLGRLGRPRLVASGVWLHIRKKMDGHQYQKRSPWLIGDHTPIYLYTVYPHATISNKAQLIDWCPHSLEVSPHKNSNLGSLYARWEQLPLSHGDLFYIRGHEIL